MAYPVTVVGVGPGSAEYLTPAAVTAVREAEVLVGGRHALTLFADGGQRQMRIGNNLDQVLDFIAEERETRRVAVLVSGDPGFFSLLPRLKERFGEGALIVIPGISSLQLAAARLGLDWHQIRCLSVHGRELEQLHRAADAPLVAVLTGTNFPPAAVCSYFLKRGWECDNLWVCTDLGRECEEITRLTLAEGAKIKGRINSLVILQRSGRKTHPEVDQSWLELATPGLPNELYQRGEVAISQEEVRILAICKAQLKRGMVVHEIGAGSGSWTVEVARLITPGSLWAVERNPEAVRLIRANLQRFGIANVHLVQGEAPEACREFPRADAVLIGGSGGRLDLIIAQAKRRLNPGGMLVLTAVTPDTFSTAWQLLGNEGWQEREALLASFSHVSPRGRAQIWQGENPAFILRAKKS